jgi:hypothetical protein
MKHDNKLSANPEADQLWKEFERRLDKANEDNLFDLVTDDLLSRVIDPKNIQCLNLKALGDIMGKVQVLQGQIRVMQVDPEMPQGELHMLHAKLQVLCGTMFPHLAVRIKQAPVSLLKKPIQMKSAGGEAHPANPVEAPPGGEATVSVDVVSGSTDDSYETDQASQTSNSTS